MKQTPQLAKDYRHELTRKISTTIILASIVSIAAMITLLLFLGVLSASPVAFAAILVAHAGLVTGIALLVYSMTVQPLKDILAAIVHVSGEPLDGTPPNPNDIRFEKNGFKDVLQTIYELAGTSKQHAITATDGPTISGRSMLETALDETNCGFVVLNQDRHITFSNKAAPVDVDKDGVSQLHLIFNGEDTLDKWLDECEHTSVHAEHTWNRIPNKLPEQEGRRFFDVMASYNKGAESEVVIALVDRTNTYSSSEQELDFIAFAAHELRGPITVIRGYLDVLQDELQSKLEPDQVELFHRLTVSANRLSGYINNILNTSRHDRRHLKMHLIETTAAAIYSIIQDDMSMRAGAQGRLLTVNIPQDLPNIAADPASLSEVFGNLIDNAIKYSNEGGAITITGRLSGDFVEISVKDTGIGMPSSVVSNLFQKFYRSHRSRETVAGTGIGLYISRAIVESHGGSISVRSEEGRGSEFTVSIPTYQSVADQLKAGNNSNETFIKEGSGWIKNHSMYRG